MKSASFGHEALRNRYVFEGSLQLLSPLRLSSGRASDETDAPLMRDRSDRVYIPGSSLRGALRSEVERVLSGAEGTGLRGCVLFSADGEEGACLTASREKQRQLADCEERARRPEAKPDERREPAAFLERELCDVCKLFGSPHYASRLAIEDVLPQEEAKVETTVRDGVGIDRDTGRAREGIKFNYEVLETGPKLRLRMQAENVTDTDRRLLGLVFALLRQGLFIGGKRSAGLGKVQLQGDLAVRGFEAPGELWQALVEGRDPHREISWKEGLSC